MRHSRSGKLSSKKRYLQVALNGTISDAREIIWSLPVSDRILIEAGTPLIKRYGEEGIREIRELYEAHVSGERAAVRAPSPGVLHRTFIFTALEKLAAQAEARKEGDFEEESGPSPEEELGGQSYESSEGDFGPQRQGGEEAREIHPYVVADLKTMDRAETEVAMAARAGASAAIALGSAPVETLDSFIEQCEAHGMDAMVDMMNVEFPLGVLGALKRAPPVVILHRGVDEEKFNREKQIPLHEIRRIKGRYDVMISIAGGDTLREVQRSVFNDADIVVVWKSVFQKTAETAALVEGFLREIK